MQKNKYKYIYALLIGLFMIIGCAQYEKAKEDLAFLTPERFQCSVMMVFSGDRFLCQFSDSDNVQIDLIGIRIPKDKEETAKKYTKSVLKRGLYVSIEPETQAIDNRENISAYVFIQGNRMLNLILIEKGLADLNIDEVTKYKSRYLEVQEKVRINEIEIIEEKQN